MSPLSVAAVYGLAGGLIGNGLAALLAVTVRRELSPVRLGTALGLSGGFVLGAALLDIVPEALAGSRAPSLVGIGLVLGMAFMLVLGRLLAVYGVGIGQQTRSASDGGAKELQHAGRVELLAIGIAVHNVPESMPIGSALVISPTLSLLVALVMAVENFAEAGAIAGEALRTKWSAARVIWVTTWPGLCTVMGAPLGVLLAGISPVLLALTLSFAAGIMLFIAGEVWADGRKLAGDVWSSLGLVAGVVLAVIVTGAPG